MAMYPVLGLHVGQSGATVPGAVDFDVQVNVNGLPYPLPGGARFALVPLDFAASNTLNGAQQPTSCAATQSTGALLQPVPVSFRYLPHLSVPEQHTQSRQTSNRYEVNPATQANQYTLLAHSANAPVTPLSARRDESLLTVGNTKMFSVMAGGDDLSSTSRTVGSKSDADNEHVANGGTRHASWSTANTRHATLAQTRVANSDVVDGCSPAPCTITPLADRDEASDYVYVSRRGETCFVDANNNETSGFVETDLGSPVTTPLNSACGEKLRSGPVSLSDVQHTDNDVTRTSRWDELATSDVANAEASTSPSERRRESTPIGTSSSEGESESKREELDGAIADVSAVGPDSPRSAEGDADALADRSVGKQRRTRPEVEPVEASRPQLDTTRAYVLNVHSEPWYPSGLRPISEKSLLVPARDKENFVCPPTECSYDAQLARSDTLDNFAADMSRSLAQSGGATQHHLAPMSWSYVATPSVPRNSQPLSHARRNPPSSAQLYALPVANQAGTYVFPHPHVQANGHDGVVQPQTQAQPKRIRLSASGAAALQLNNIDINRLATVAPLSYGTEQHTLVSHSHGIVPPAFPAPHACRPPSSVPGTPGSTGPGEDKVAANMKRLFTKIVETFDGLTADDAISIIRQVKIKRNGLKGLTMKTILSDAIEIVKEMNAMAGAPQQNGPVSIVPATQAHEMTQLGLPSGVSMSASWNGKTAGIGERRGVISLARPAHEEPCLDVNCTDFLQYCKYKTELCAQQQAAGRCKMGAKCVYAHGAAELRPIRKLRMCNGMAKYGYCAYGDKCLWAHSEAELYHETLDDRLAWYHAGRPACLTIADAHRAPSMAPHPLGLANVPATSDSTDSGVASCFESVWTPSHVYVDDQQRLALNAGRPRLSALQNIAPAAEHRINQETLGSHLAPAATRAWYPPTAVPGKTQTFTYDNASLQNASPCLICGCSLRLRRPRTIECGHEFHDDCIRRWTFTQDLACPICGRSISGLNDSPSAFGVQPTGGLASTR